MKERFSLKDVAGSVEVWWEMKAAFDANFRDEKRLLFSRDVRGFLRHSHDQLKCPLPRTKLVDILLLMKLRYDWVRRCFDGASGYKTTDDVVERLEEIASLAMNLAERTETVDTFYLLGPDVLNLEALARYSDSQGHRHAEASTFYGHLMARICIDCTALSEGLSEVRQRTARRGGRPPILSKYFLIFAAIDLYEGFLGRGPIVWSSPKAPENAESYSGDFWDFVLAFTDVVAPEDFPQKRINTGFGSDVAKCITAFRRDPKLMEGLNPHAHLHDLLLSTNRLASLK